MTTEDVVVDFENLINPFCEQYHIITGTARPEICKRMVEKFKKIVTHKENWIRTKIDSKFKPPHRVRNGKLRSNKSRIGRIPKKINKLEKEFAELTKVAIDYANR